MSSELRHRWTQAGGTIPDSWKIITLESLLKDSKSIAVGVMYPGPDTIGGVPLIKVGDIKGGQIPQKPTYCISQETNNEHRRTQLVGDELLITLVGNPGECVVVTPAMAGWNPARAIAVIRLSDPELRVYLKTVLESAAGKHLIDAVLNTTVQKTLNLKDVRQLPIPMPPRESIRSISAFSEALAERINLLRETNATLEAIAQALFKSWFVDFEPVHANAGTKDPSLPPEIQALFPATFTDSPQGPIPEGWSVKACQEIIDVRDGTHASPKPSETGYPLVTSRHITSGELSLDDTYLISEAEFLDISKRSKVDHLDVLLTMIGTVGIPAFVLSESTNFAIKNIGLFKTSKRPDFSAYIYLLLKSKEMQNYLHARMAGTTQKYLSLKALREIAIIEPSPEIIKAFSENIQPIFEGIQNNRVQVQALTDLRDTLLPRLISGQLRLPETEQAIAAIRD